MLCSTAAPDAFVQTPVSLLLVQNYPLRPRLREVSYTTYTTTYFWMVPRPMVSAKVPPLPTVSLVKEEETSSLPAAAAHPHSRRLPATSHRPRLLRFPPVVPSSAGTQSRPPESGCQYQDCATSSEGLKGSSCPWVRPILRHSYFLVSPSHRPAFFVYPCQIFTDHDTHSSFRYSHAILLL